MHIIIIKNQRLNNTSVKSQKLKYVQGIYGDFRIPNNRPLSKLSSSNIKIKMQFALKEDEVLNASLSGKTSFTEGVLKGGYQSRLKFGKITLHA